MISATMNILGWLIQASLMIVIINVNKIAEISIESLIY